jgi:GH18 family chitinase
MKIRSQLNRFFDGMSSAAGQLSRQQRRSLERRRRKEPRPSLSPESLEARALLAVVVPGYEVTQDWGSGFQGAMSLENRDIETVENWTVSFDYDATISSIWDAKVISRDGDRYTISNAGWNGSLAPGATVSFGFIGSGDTAAPTNYTINGEPIDDASASDPPAGDPGSTPDDGPLDDGGSQPGDPVAPPVAGVSAEFRVVSDWGTGFTGDVVLSNDGTVGLSDWRVQFEFAGDIGSLWNGEVESRTGSTYVVKGAGWNADLAAGGRVNFGFNASPGGASAVLTGLTVFAAGETPEVAPPDTNPDPGTDPVTPPADPGDGGGTTPGTDTGDTDGRVFAVNPAAADIVGFNPATDRLDFGDISVHNLIVGKRPSGEVAIVNPWAWTPEYQVVDGIGFTDLSIENYGVVVNEHLRQDLGGVISWELGVGPRESGTVYVRSHEYGVEERVEGFDPAVNKLSFLYFGTRERLAVEDTADGVLISVQPTGQSVLLVGVAKSDLLPANLEFHHDQIVEDQLEVPFGFTVEQVTMVSRSELLTPLAPDGAITDGHQTSPGSDNPHDGHDHGDMPMDPGMGTDPGTDPVDDGTSDPGTDPGADPGADPGTDPTGDTPPADPPADPGSDTGGDTGGDSGGDPVVDVPASDLPIASYDGIIAAYFPEWGIYGRDYQLDDVPADKINRLIYAFANLTADGEMTLYDSYAAVEKRFGAHESVSGEADQWYYPPEDPRSQQTIWGNFNQLAQLKEKFPHLRTSIAVGGWTLSTHFSTVASTEAGRQAFADSIVDFLTTYTMFDGVDFDWEYPGGGGLSSNAVSPNDGENYALLLEDVREHLDVLEAETGRVYEISVASPAGLDKIANFNLEGLTPSVDYYNLMAYDFHGTWENTTGHQAAFTADPKGYDIKTAVNAYLDAGVPGEKIVLGAPLYTRGWSGVADGGDGGYDEAASGGAPGTFEKGVYDYKDLLAQVQDPNGGWQLYWDDVAQASYVYNAELDLFSSFETPTSIALKAQWVQEMGLGGMMFWDLTNDATDSPESLIAAAFRSLVLEDDFQSIRESSSLRNEVIIGGDGEINPWALI